MNSSRRSFIRKAALVTAATGMGFSCSGGKQTPAAEVIAGSKNQGFRSCKNHPPDRACLSAGNSNHAVEYRQVEHNKIV